MGPNDDRPQIILTEEEKQELIDYEILRRQVLAAYKARGYGTGQQASRELKLSAATISGVLSGRLIDIAILRTIDQWMQTAEEPKSSRSRR
jgi:hypothetical protein